MNARLLGVGITLAALAVAACGGDDKGSTTTSSSGGTSGTTSSGASGGEPATEADAGDGTTPTPKAAGPKLTSVSKMTGSLHVFWDLPATCDGVELERKDGDADFKKAYELPGSVDNKHDGKATEDMVYTYRVRCKVGAEYTEYSNEMGKNPTK